MDIRYLVQAGIRLGYDLIEENDVTQRILIPSLSLDTANAIRDKLQETYELGILEGRLQELEKRRISAQQENVALRLLLKKQRKRRLQMPEI